MSIEPEKAKIVDSLKRKIILNLYSSDVPADQQVKAITKLANEFGLETQEVEIDWNPKNHDYWFELRQSLQKGNLVIMRSPKNIPEDLELQRNFMRNLRSTNEAAQTGSKKPGSIIVISEQRIDYYREELGRVRQIQI